MASPVKTEETKGALKSGDRDLTEDPRYKQGKALLKELKYDESLELLGLLVAEVYVIFTSSFPRSGFSWEAHADLKRSYGISLVQGGG